MDGDLVGAVEVLGSRVYKVKVDKVGEDNVFMGRGIESYSVFTKSYSDDDYECHHG